MAAVATFERGVGNPGAWRWFPAVRGVAGLFAASWLACAALTVSASTLPTAPHHERSDLWVLKPVVRPEVPAGVAQSTNPIDAFIAAEYRAKLLQPVGPADKPALLRRVYLDLIGIPPTPAEQEAFLADCSDDAYEKVVDRLLANEQYAVRYARHWLDVLRYADVDDGMVAAPGIYLWRDWVIRALDEDLPYDQFVRAQLTGYRSTVRTEISATGYRSRVEPRADDIFALGFLSRGATPRGIKDDEALAITAVETVSTAFMGMTVGCAKCHDHMYDPIKQRDFYAMKALFDPLLLRKVNLASAEDLFASGKAQEKAAERRATLEGPIDELARPYKEKLYQERLVMLPADVQAVVQKPEKERTVQEQKIADDYYPILRIDPEKIVEVMPEDVKKKYEELRKQLDSEKGGGRGRHHGVPAFWTVEVDHAKELEKSYILTSGNPERPEMNHEVEPGWPFAPSNIDFRDGRIEAFSDWLTAPENPLFARVAVNRLWQWHFGRGLEKTPSDFGTLGGAPSHPRLLDWLAAEFVKRNFSMKQMHRLIVTSETYKLASTSDGEVAAADEKIDPEDTFLWRFRLQRLEAEPIWDSIFTAAGDLDLKVGGESFNIRAASEKHEDGAERSEKDSDASRQRRAVYMVRGYSANRDAMPSFLQAFDVDDGRVPCPMRTQTVTAPQALFMMNDKEIEKASVEFGKRLEKESGGDLTGAVKLGYRIALGRAPSASENGRALAYLDHDPARLKNFAWLLFNLDEFVYVR
jgi:Protein of unknown function (DUF1553)/Protein of unknown function (DUF1549)